MGKERKSVVRFSNVDWQEEEERSRRGVASRKRKKAQKAARAHIKRELKSTWLVLMKPRNQKAILKLRERDEAFKVSFDSLLRKDEEEPVHGDAPTQLTAFQQRPEPRIRFSILRRKAYSLLVGVNSNTSFRKEFFNQDKVGKGSSEDTKEFRGACCWLLFLAEVNSNPSLRRDFSNQDKVGEGSLGDDELQEGVERDHDVTEKGDGNPLPPHAIGNGTDQPTADDCKTAPTGGALLVTSPTTTTNEPTSETTPGTVTP